MTPEQENELEENYSKPAKKYEDRRGPDNMKVPVKKNENV